MTNMQIIRQYLQGLAIAFLAVTGGGAIFVLASLPYALTKHDWSFTPGFALMGILVGAFMLWLVQRYNQECRSRRAFEDMLRDCPILANLPFVETDQPVLQYRRTVFFADQPAPAA